MHVVNAANAIDTCAKLSTKFFIEKLNNVAIHNVTNDNNNND